MRLITSASARLLGLHHVRVWKLTSDQPLLRADDGLSAEAAAGAWEQDAPELPAGYRTLLADLGYAGTTPAGERLREGVRTRGWRSHGAVVDAVSVATLRHGAGIGLHSLFKEDEGSDLVITRAAGTERIVPAFSTKSKPVPAGDLLYGLADPDGAVEEPFAWLGRRDCDAASRQLAPDSGEALLVVLGCPGEDAAHSEAIGATVATLLAGLRPDVTLTPVA